MMKTLLSFFATACVLLSQAKHATYVSSKEMDAAYPKHSVVVDQGGYRVMAIGREKSGEAEVHGKSTDIVYFVEGSATLTTGGAVLNGKTIAPDEIRGKAIAGGEQHRLQAGDVITIPNGTPHQFTVQTSCRYFLVKVRTNDEGKPAKVTPFSKGGALGAGDGYKASASHREKDGIAEVHARDSDIMLFIRGTGTAVTGGKAEDAKATSPEETRGTNVSGGVRQTLKPGDVIVVPNTVPHQFVDVKGPLDYFVVKVRSAE